MYYRSQRYVKTHFQEYVKYNDQKYTWNIYLKLTRTWCKIIFFFFHTFPNLILPCLQLALKSMWTDWQDWEKACAVLW